VGTASATEYAYLSIPFLTNLFSVNNWIQMHGSNKELDSNTENSKESVLLQQHSFQNQKQTMVSFVHNQVSYAKPKCAFLPKNIANT
jgi:hypothetical protein